MAQWNDDKELFDLMKEKLYTPVVGDILDQMGYKHQFLPAAIRPWRLWCRRTRSLTAASRTTV